MLQVTFVIEGEPLHSTADDSATWWSFCIEPGAIRLDDSQERSRKYKESKRDLSGIFLFNQRFDAVPADDYDVN